MKKYKVRLNCVGFEDIVVQAKNKEEAKSEAGKIAGNNCSQPGFEFCEFLPVEEGDEIEN